MTARKPAAATGTPRRKDREPVQLVNVNFPLDLLARIDREAARIGIARQAWIKLRLADILGPETHD